MKLDNLSKHGILTGSLIIIFLTMLIVVAANKIHQIHHLAETFKDFNEFEQNPPPSLDVPVGVIVISLVLIVITALMILGIVKENVLLVAPWIITFSLGGISEIIFFTHHLVGYFSIELLLYILCILGTQLLIFSPIFLLFNSIRSKNKTQLIFKTNLEQEN